MSNRLSELRPMPPKPAPEPSHPGFVPCGLYARPEMELCPRLFRFVRRHVFGAYLLGREEHGRSRAGLVIGPSGVGKTAELLTSISRIPCEVVVIDGATMSGAEEGAPCTAIDEVESFVMARTKITGGLIAWVIDDADLVFAQDVERTINSNLLASRWQTLLSTGGMKDAFGTAIPIFLTGNDFSQARETTMRLGRVSVHVHNPTGEELLGKCRPLFPGVEEKALRGLLRAHSDKPIAFFAALRARVREETLDALIDQHGLDIGKVGEALQSTELHFDITRLRVIANEMASATTGNYLRRNR